MRTSGSWSRQLATRTSIAGGQSRSQPFAFLTLIAIAGATAIWMVTRYLHSIEAVMGDSPEDAIADVGAMLKLASWLVSGTALAGAVVLVRASLHAMRSGQSPPPERVSQSGPQPVRSVSGTGSVPAQLRAILGLAVAALLVACAVRLPILIAQLVRSLTSASRG